MALVLTTPEPERLLQTAIDDFTTTLSDDQRAQLHSIKSVPDADAVLVFTAELDRKRQGETKRGRSIATRLSKILCSVRDFSSIIDTFVSSHPDIAALVWGSIKLTMHIVINFASYYEAVAEFFMKIGQSSPLFREYQALFPGSERLQKRLCGYHASLIKCCSHIVVVVQRSVATIVLKALRMSFEQEFKQDAIEIERCRNEVEQEIKFATAQAVMRTQQIVQLEAQNSKKSGNLLSRFRQETTTKLDDLKEMQLLRDEEAARSRKQDLIEALSTHDHEEPFRRERKKRFNGTANWLFDTTEFKHWMSTTRSALLWCSGKMGSGKTILSTSMIDHIYIHKSSKTDLAAFFFARFDLIHSIQLETILRSILRQLIDRDTMSEDLLSSLEEVRTSPSFSSRRFQQLILEIIRPQQTLFMILDGLDACSQVDQRELYKVLACLSSARPSIKVFLTSHLAAPSTLIASFSVAEEISTSHPASQIDMRYIVSEAVQTALDDEVLLVRDKSLIDDIKETLTTHANGMLLWVTLQLREICAQRCDEAIRAAISDKRLPKDLAGVLDLVLSRIISGRNEKITQQILPWILAAKRPLNLTELEECGFIEILQPESMNDRRVNGIHRIDSWFEGLVEVDEELRTVHFIHGSIQQFLLNPPSEPGLASFHFDAEEVDHHLGEICITFLNFNDLDRTIAKRPKPMPSPVTPNIMLQHAINFEPHLKQLRSIRRTDLISKFKSAPTLVDTDSNLANSTFRSSPASGVFEALGSEHPFIRYAAIHWLSHATGFEKNRSKTWSLWESMVMRGHQLAYSPTTDRIHICLDDDLVAWSLEVRHTGLLHLILASNQHGIHGMEVLGWAVQEEDEEMVRLFLQHNRGIAVTSQHLFASVKHGRHEMVRLLIEYSVDLDLNYPQPWFDSCTPLQHCATVGDYMMLRILIEAGATLDTHEPNQNTPLGLATHHGHYECMRLLLSSGAKVNYSTPLGAPLKFAIKRSDIEAVKILLEAGAQVNAKPTGLIKRSFLLIAVEQVSFSDFAIRKAGLDVIRMLLECGADANGHPLDDPTPLQAAVIRENVEVASLLIANGADLNCPGAGRSSPLQLAMTTGAFDLIGFLLREGADPNRPVSEGRPPLEIASMLGNFKLVRLLISFNANPNGSSLDGLTFLQRASFQGDLGIVNVLLEAGAIVDATNGTYSRKPLMLASAGGYVDIQKVLLGRGASVDSTSPGEEGVTALQCAVDSGSFQAVKVLLEAGAEVKSSLMYKSMMSRSDCNEIPDLLRSYAAIQKTRSDGTGHSRKPSNGDTETET